MTRHDVHVRRGATSHPDATRAAQDLADQLEQPDPRLTLLFCGPGYDLDALGAALSARLQGPIIGCTTAGELGPGGFATDSIVGVSLGGPLSATVFTIDLERCEEDAMRVADEVSRLLAEGDGRPAFGLLLVDGMSQVEERLTATLYQHLGVLPIVGGSAGDNLAFKRTHVLSGGRYRSGIATLTVVSTDAPFLPVKFEHFEATDRIAVITDADPERRLVREINGLPAVDAYAALLGVEPAALTDQLLSANPLVLDLDGEVFLRSVASCNPDGSLTLFCAIDDGVVLSLGRSTSPIEAARRAFGQVRETVGEPSLIIGCDCILRRLELSGSHLIGEMGALMAQNRVVGFSTYGEQFNAMHVNQTFTGIALGG